MRDLQNIKPLYTKVRELILEARSVVSRTVNFVTVVQNWEIGRMIVEEEQGGKAKAEYGKFVIKELSVKLSEEFGGSYSVSNLKRYRQFYLTYQISAALRHQLNNADNKENKISAALWHQSSAEIIKAVQTKSHPLFQIISPYLSWSHYKSLITVENPKAREFYIKEAVENNWGTRALDRQINSLYYERLLSSQDKKPVTDEMKEKTSILQPEDVLKDPYILEFLELTDNTKFRESELEEALIDKLNNFVTTQQPIILD